MATPSGTLVQLGAYKSQAEAESNWAEDFKKILRRIAGQAALYRARRFGGKGVFYRLQLAPFVSSKEAEDFCVDLVSESQGCFPAKGK